VYGNVVRRRLQTGHVPHRVHQHLPVMRPCPSNQRPVNIEKY
jgi:hypothetical protein